MPAIKAHEVISSRVPVQVLVTRLNGAPELRTIAACGQRDGEPVYFFVDGSWLFVDQCVAPPPVTSVETYNRLHL